MVQTVGVSGKLRLVIAFRDSCASTLWGCGDEGYASPVLLHMPKLNLLPMRLCLQIYNPMGSDKRTTEVVLMLDVMLADSVIIPAFT